MSVRYRRGPYKRYLNGEVSVPRQTVKRWIQEVQSDSDSDSSESSKSGSVCSAQVEQDRYHADTEEHITCTIDTNSSDDEGSADETGDDGGCNTDEHLESGSSESEFSDGNFDGGNDLSSGNATEQSSEPLYVNASVSLRAAAFLIMSVCMAFSASHIFIENLLLVIGFLLPCGHKLPSSYHKFVQLFSDSDAPLILHRFCDHCQTYLGKKDEIVAQECPSCNNSLVNTPRSSCGIFIEIPQDKILKSFMEVDRLYERLSYPEERTKENGDAVYEDVYDGTEYKKIERNLFDLSILWNCDGLPIFKSSSFQLWPIQCIILELPPLLRNKFSFVSGLWFGYKKPIMEIFLKPFVECCTKLFNEGFHWTHPETRANVVSYVNTLVCSCDAVARCSLQNMSQFNGFYGCGLCEQKAESVTKGNGTVRVYPLSNPPANMRNDKEIARQAQIALESGIPEKGVKGPSVTSCIPMFSVGRSFVPDYMHSVLLGVVRSMMTIWIDSSYHESLWYIGNRTSDINKRLLSIRPLNEITRTPRSLNTRKYWKASEYRNWLLWYSLPVLQGILPTPYLQHFMLLSVSVSMLVSSSVNKRNVQLAKHFLDSFVEDVAGLYGKEHCSFNVHQLTHLAVTVQRWGPLWAHSAFPFENNNQIFKKLIHGTQSVQLQVVGALQIMRRLKHFRQHMGEDGDVIELANRVNGKLNSQNREPVGPELFLLGKPVVETLSPAASEAAFRCIGQPMVHRVPLYKRAVVKNKMLHSKEYEENGSHLLKRNNSTVFYNDGQHIKIGQMEIFFKHNEQGYVIINCLKEVNPGFVHRETNYKVEHVIVVKEMANKVTVPLSAIIEKVLFMEVGGKLYIGKLPNEYEYNL